jgi:glycogen debranching enzyme
MDSLKVNLEKYVESRETCGLTLNDLFICAGNRSYMVGHQNGGFPDFGHHVKDEMGGLWDHPIKLMDGFWLQISDDAARGKGEAEGEWLAEADSFHNFPYYNEHQYRLQGLQLEVVRRQFCPDDTEGFVIAYRIRDTSGTARQLTLRFLGRTDLSPVWFSEEKGIVAGYDTGWLDSGEGVLYAKDDRNPWYVAFGADRPYTNGKIDASLFGPHATVGKGVSGLLTYDFIEVPAGGETEIRFFVAGSYTSEPAVRETYARLKREHAEMWETKSRRYEGIANRSVLSIPDESLQKVFEWVKFHNDWLVREVPEIGRGLGAGHPEYSWWFGCDNSYALLGLLPVGELELAQQTLDLLQRVSERENGNGRIIHELSTCDAVANFGNTQETPHFIQCVWEVFLWTGDIEFLRRMYPTVKKGLAWLLEEMDPDGDLLPEGYGIIEIEGLNVELIDSAAYTWSALRAGSHMAVLFGEPEWSRKYTDLSERLGEKINRDLWMEKEGLYADAMATVGKVLDRMDIYIDRARNSDAEETAQELERMKADMSMMDPDSEQPWLFKNWVINTPMETGLAPRDKAIRALDRMGTDEFTGPWGTYLSGMYRTAMMTISTGVQAVAEARYDRMNESLRFVRLIASTFNMRLPGSISEMSPDYGCFVQAWTNYGITWPLMSYMFGIRPRAYWNELSLRPRLPDGWNEVSVEKVEVGLGGHANRLGFYISLSETTDVYRVELAEPGWTVRIDLPNAAIAGITLDGVKVLPIEVDGAVFLEIQNAGKHEVRVIRA